MRNVDPTGLAVMPAPQDGEPPEPSPRCPPGTIDLNLRDYANNPVCIPDGFTLDKYFQPAPSRPALRFQPLPNGTIILNQNPAPANATTATGGWGGARPGSNDVIEAALKAAICTALILAILQSLTDADVGKPRPPRQQQDETIWRTISTNPRFEQLNFSPSRRDIDGLSGTRAERHPFWRDPVQWFKRSMGRNPDVATDRVVATSRRALLAAGFSVVNSPIPSQDRWHVSIGGVTPGVIADSDGVTWRGPTGAAATTAARRQIRERLAGLFSRQVWP